MFDFQPEFLNHVKWLFERQIAKAHTYKSNLFDIREGDMVKVRARKTEMKHKFSGVLYFARPRDQRNPDGYIVDRGGREASND